MLNDRLFISVGKKIGFCLQFWTYYKDLHFEFTFFIFSIDILIIK